MMNEYRKLRNQVGHMMEQSKTDYLNDMSLLYSNDPNGLWKEIHKLAGSDKHINDIHPNLDSNEFNTLFTNVGTKISDTFIKDPQKWKKS